MGVALRRYTDFLIHVIIIINFIPILLVLALFCSSNPTSLFILKMFFIHTAL